METSSDRVETSVDKWLFIPIPLSNVESVDNSVRSPQVTPGGSKG